MAFTLEQIKAQRELLRLFNSQSLNRFLAALEYVQ